MNTKVGSYLLLTNTAKAALVEGLGAPTEEKGVAVTNETMAMAIMVADERLAKEHNDREVAERIGQLCASVLERGLAAAQFETRAHLLEGLLDHDRIENRVRIEGLTAEYLRRIAELENIAGQPKRHTMPWTEFEESRLVKLYRSGKTEAQIARSLQRYGDAVCIRLGKLINEGETWGRYDFESEELWTQRHRDYFFRGTSSHGNCLLIEAPMGNWPLHIKEAFEATPEPTRAAA